MNDRADEKKWIRGFPLRITDRIHKLWDLARTLEASQYWQKESSSMITNNIKLILSIKKEIEKAFNCGQLDVNIPFIFNLLFNVKIKFSLKWSGIKSIASERMFVSIKPCWSDSSMFRKRGCQRFNKNIQS